MHPVQEQKQPLTRADILGTSTEQNGRVLFLNKTRCGYTKLRGPCSSKAVEARQSI